MVFLRFEHGRVCKAAMSLTSSPRTVLLLECEGATADPSSPTAETLSEATYGGDGSGGGFEQYQYLVTGSLGQPAQSYPTRTPRHGGGSNFLLGDGRVKWLRGADVSPGQPAAAEGDAQGTAVTAAGTACPTFSATFSPL